MLEYHKPQKMLGPSQVATVLGCSKFQTLEELRDRMENGYTRPITDSLQAGMRDERKCRSLYMDHTGNLVRKCPFIIDLKNPRFGGSGDGLVLDGGVEFKCQYNDLNDPIVYHDYKIQAICYMYLYNCPWWDIFVCRIDQNENVLAILERIYWKDYEKTWTEKWYPQITEFINSVTWQR